MGIITEAVMSNLELSIYSLNNVKKQLESTKDSLDIGIRNPFIRRGIEDKISFIISEIDKIKDETYSILEKETDAL